MADQVQMGMPSACHKADKTANFRENAVKNHPKWNFGPLLSGPAVD
jgi:hypothetical protein